MKQMVILVPSCMYCRNRKEVYTADHHFYQEAKYHICFAMNKKEIKDIDSCPDWCPLEDATEETIKIWKK